MVIKHCFVEVNGSFVHLEQHRESHDNNKNNDPFLDTKLISNKGQRLNSSTSQTGNSLKNEPAADETNDANSGSLVIFIPGNPGALGVYHDFLTLISSAATVLAISHNDFDHPDHVSYAADEKIFIDEKELNFVEKTRSKQYLHDPHHVELQILNKLIILKRLVLRKSKRIFFVGHSIGCYVILRLLQDKQLAEAHAGSVLIHPALENLALTEKGSHIDRMFGLRLDLPMRLVAYILDILLPRPLKMMLTRQFCSPEFVAKSSEDVLEAIMQLACSRHLNALIGMAKSELALVKQLDCEQLIRPHVPKLQLHYAQVDHWVNGSHRQALKRIYKENIHIEERDTLHAFVMDPRAVVEYARVVAQLIASRPA